MVVMYSSISGPFKYLIGETKHEVWLLTNSCTNETIVVSPLLSANKFVFVFEESDLKFDYKRNEIIEELTNVINLEFKKSHCLKMDIYKLGKLHEYGDLKKLRAKNEQYRVDFVQNSETVLAIWNTRQIAICRDWDGTISIAPAEFFKQNSLPESENIPSPAREMISFSTRVPFSYSTDFDGSNVDLTVTNQNVCLNSDVVEKIESPKTPLQLVPSSSPSLKTERAESPEVIENLSAQDLKVEPSLPSSSQLPDFTNPELSNYSLFSKCAKCHCMLDGLQKESGQNKRVCNILSCGHVVCNFCVNRTPPNSTPFVSPILRNNCPLCLKAETRFSFPIIHETGAYCALHNNKEAKFYCEECMRFLCSEKDCKEHSAIRIEEIAVKNNEFERKLCSASLYIQEMNTIEEKSKKCLLYLDEKSSQLEKSFNLLIDAAARRYSEIQTAIQSEKVEVSKSVEQIAKDLEGAKRRVVVAYNVHETACDTSSFPDEFTANAYKLAARSILEKGLEISEHLKTSPENMQGYKLDFEGENRVEDVVKDVRMWFPEYTVSKGKDCEVYEVPSYTELKIRKKCHNYLKDILANNDGKSDITMPIPPRRKKVRSLVAPQTEKRDSEAVGDSNVPVKKYKPITVLTAKPKTVEQIFEEEKRNRWIMEIIEKNKASSQSDQYPEPSSSSGKDKNSTIISPPLKRPPCDIPDRYQILEAEVKRKRNVVPPQYSAHSTEIDQIMTLMEEPVRLSQSAFPRKSHEFREEEKSSLIDTEIEIKQELIVEEMPTTSNEEDSESTEETGQTSNNTKAQFIPPHRKKPPTSIPEKYQVIGTRRQTISTQKTVEEIFEEEKRNRRIMEIIEKNKASSQSDLNPEPSSSSGKDMKSTIISPLLKRPSCDIPDKYKILKAEAKRKRNVVESQHSAHSTEIDQIMTLMEEPVRLSQSEGPQKFREEEKCILIDTEIDIKQEMIVEETPTTSNEVDCESTEETGQTSDNTKSQFIPPHRKKPPTSIPEKYQALGTRRQTISTQKTVEEIFEEEKRNRWIMEIIEKNKASHEKKVSSQSDQYPEPSSSSGKDMKSTIISPPLKRPPCDIPDKYKILKAEAKRKRNVVESQHSAHSTEIDQIMTLMEEPVRLSQSEGPQKFREEEKCILIDTEIDIKQEMIVEETPTTSNEVDCESTEETGQTSDNTKSQFIPPHRKKPPTIIPEKYQALGTRRQTNAVEKLYTVNYANFIDAFQNTTYKQEPFTLLTSEFQDIVLRKVDELCEEEKSRRKGTKIDYVKEKSIIEEQRNVIQVFVEELYQKQTSGELLSQVVKEEDIELEPREIVLRIDPPGVMDKEIKEEENE